MTVKRPIMALYWRAFSSYKVDITRRTAVTLQISSANAIAKRFALDTADGLKAAGDRAVDTAVRLLSQLEEAGARKEDRAALRDTILDTTRRSTTQPLWPISIR